MAAIQCGDPGKVRETASLFSQNKVNMAEFGNRACKQTDPAEGWVHFLRITFMFNKKLCRVKDKTLDSEFNVSLSL